MIELRALLCNVVMYRTDIIFYASVHYRVIKAA